ncbi:hypothetical protein NDU88_002983, partial [Pleurodeles waltl]
VSEPPVEVNGDLGCPFATVTHGPGRWNPGMDSRRGVHVSREGAASKQYTVSQGVQEGNALALFVDTSLLDGGLEDGPTRDHSFLSFKEDRSDFWRATEPPPMLQSV